MSSTDRIYPWTNWTSSNQASRCLWSYLPMISIGSLPRARISCFWKTSPILKSSALWSWLKNALQSLEMWRIQGWKACRQYLRYSLGSPHSVCRQVGPSQELRYELYALMNRLQPVLDLIIQKLTPSVVRILCETFREREARFFASRPCSKPLIFCPFLLIQVVA